MSRIELKHIDKFYGTNHVLRDINLVIEDGDFMTLLGPSGCGKTTTLRVVSGLEKPQNGIMTIDGVEMINADDAYYAEPSKRGLNLVFQSYALWPHMTVYDNIAFGLKIQKMSKADRDALVQALKDDANARQQQLIEIVRKSMTGQASTWDKSQGLKSLFENLTVDADTIAQAQKDIAEDGYWGVEKTSDRILDFAKALSGGDKDKADELLNAFKKGFSQATGAWGDKLPSICQDTYDAVVKKFDDWKNGTEDTQVQG